MKTVSYKGFEGNRLEADVYGTGSKTALLLHGGGQTRHAWRQTARKLSEHGYTAIALDQRGHGASDWVTSKAYGFIDYRDDLEAVTKQIGGKPAVIGASLGGIAGLYAEGKGESLFSALVMVDISPFMEAKGVDAVQNFMRDKMKEGFATIDEAGEAVARYIPNRKKPPSHEGLKKNLRLINGRYYWHWDPGFMEGPRTVNFGKETLQAELINAAKRLTIPTLLVRGGSSDIISPENAKAFIDIVPHAKFIDVAGAGHMVAGDKNDAFTNAVLGFMG
jgi:pimeloyl-ACP methyl ester carboxylesterase